MGLSLLRDFVMSVPLVLLLPVRLGVTGTLLSAPIADMVSFVAVVVIMTSVMKQLKAGNELTVANCLAAES